MRILTVTSEAVPFAKTGGLADVCGALPRALLDLGHDVRLVMPRYRQVDRAELEPLPGPLGVPTGAGERWCQVLEGRLPGSDVPVYFIEHDELYDRPHLYGPDEAYGDNCLRFTVLARGALQLCHKLGFQPHVVHCHDWQAALTPVYLHATEGTGSALSGAASVLTVHNLAYQGRFGAEELALTGLGREHLTPEGLEFFGDVSLLKGGIVHADLVSTVSPTYAEEIQTPEFGEGLDNVLRGRGSDVRGILNGIDEELWDPATDPLLPAHYDATNLSGKEACRRELQGRAGLPPDDDAILVGFIGRLAEQKGSDLLVEAADDLVDLGCQLVVLGTGRPEYEARLEELSGRSTAVRAFLAFDEALAHLIYAGCDLLLMPSRYEPCGLNQLYAMRYGTVPVVRDVGGLRDSVTDPEEGRRPTGYKIDGATAEALVRAVSRAGSTKRAGSGAFGDILRAGMRRKSGWTRAAADYVRLFEEARKR